MTSHKIAYIHDSLSTNNSDKLEMFLYVNGSCPRLSDPSHAHSLLRIEQ
jgi:hypothetical protein